MKLSKSLYAINPLLLKDVLFKKDERAQVFLALSPGERVDVFRSVTKNVKQDLATKLPDKELAELLQAIDPDEATDVLQLLGKRKREHVLEHLSQELKDSLSTLLEFDAETAAGLMTLDYVQLDVNDTFAEVADKFMNHEKKTGRPPIILALKDGKLAGSLPSYQLGFVDRKETISRYVKRTPSISYAATHDEVFRQFQQHPHNKVVVLNDAGHVMGIIYSDDVLKIIQDQEASSLYDFAGISPEENVTDSAKRKVQHRYQWLIINLGASFLAAFVVGLFEDTLNQFVLLAIYMPIVAGMGGNAATQTLAVLVRGIALKQIELKTAVKTLKNELGAGLVNGIINGILVGAIVYGLNRDARIALVLALAMVINLLVAALFGTLVPLIMSKLGKDPAASATIFITTATDVFGFMVFLGLGTLILT